MNVTDINAGKPPVIYAVRIAQHWDGHLEFFMEDIEPNERSLKSVAWALRQMADAIEKDVAIASTTDRKE